MRELAFYVLLFTLGIAILIPALAIAVCASTLVLVADQARIQTVAKVA